ncbi:uncharacterized protein [Procambarus clarkii]|uniref:uncharacterized protein isoform X4 n=1 Tax=Procambarus clarkii TaxID=6728 RepID=UPI001E676A0B|nr:uncharacterized protein LOC123754105 isoform X3 [Procambarus clarkii]
MEPLAEALIVVEGVIEHINHKLGSDAQEHINADLLFARAESQIKNGVTVGEAIKSIASSVLWEVQEKKDRKESEVNRIKSELEKTTAEIIVQKIKSELEKASEHFIKDKNTSLETDLKKGDTRLQSSSSHISLSSSSASEADKDALEMAMVMSVGCASNANERWLRLESTFSDSAASDEDNDISVLTPEPPKPAPLIELDDSSDSSSSSRSSICIVGNVEKDCDRDMLMFKDQIDEDDAKRIGFANKSFADLLDEERSLTRDNDRVQDMQRLRRDKSFKNDINKDKSFKDNISKDKSFKDDNISKDKSSKDDISNSIKREQTREETEVNFKDARLNFLGESSTGKQARSLPDTKHQPPAVRQKTQAAAAASLPDISKELKANGFVEEDGSKTAIINGVTNLLPDNRTDNAHPSDVLWQDAHYVCSLLPYFQLADVHQSLIDNFYHPQRIAYVLEEYINLAVDREEVVPDDVFVGLRAAKKRSHVEVGGAQDAESEKRIKVDYKSTDINNGQKLQDPLALGDGFDGALPSTSGANTLAVVRDKDESNNVPYSVQEPDVRTGANGVRQIFQNGEPVELKTDREKWCKEKMEFVCAVVCGVDKAILRAQVEMCHSEADVERLIARLLEEQEKIESIAREHLASLPSAISDQPSTSAFQPVDKTDANTHKPNPVEENIGDANMPGTSTEPQSGNEAEDQANLAADLEDTIMAQVTTLSEMFADADPDYLQERCVGINGDQAQFQLLIEELLKNKEYPKREEYNKRQKRLEIRKKFIEGMSVEEFLEYFQDPEKVFCDTEKTMNPTYMDNARAQLKRDLPYHLIRDIDNELRKHNYHYLPSLRALQENKKLSRRKTKRTSPVSERDMDDIFIKELCYVRMQTEIKEHLWKKEENKRRAFLWAKATHQLLECRCCYDDEVLEEDMDTCNAPGSKHKFCINCIRRFAEEEIGQGRTSFRCLEGECKAEFSLATLKKVMMPSIFSNILERKQLEEIAAAGIEDLVACPFCNFQTIMPNKEDKVFKCLNPECMKDSCRFCKEPNHVPLRCEEVEKQHQKDARTYMENRMTEAMVRECWKCKKRFIKEDGCNKMRCSCGAMMCYICKKQINGYAHFEDKLVPTDPTKCPLWSNSEKIHAEEVRDVADRLKQEMDPNLELVHNPLDDLPEGERGAGGDAHVYHMERNHIDSDTDDSPEDMDDMDDFIDTSAEEDMWLWF